MAFDPEPEPDRNPEEVRAHVDETIEENDVVLFMKGTELMPQCGYSRKAVSLIKQHREDVATVDVLAALDAYRDALERHSGRETIPQAYVDGEFVGGSDILEQHQQRGDLAEMLQG
jgi:monothiol glutaredoxin